jgi:Mannosyltransferase (PIG-V)
VSTEAVHRRRDSIRWSSSIRSSAPIWLATRLLTIVGAAVLAVAFGESVTRTWRQWDAGNFLDVAEHGYARENIGAFYPLYPLLIRVTGEVFGGHPALAGFLLSFPLTLAVFVAFHILARRHVDEHAALRAVLYLALFPYAFFLTALYSESLFLLLAVGAFLAAERQRFLLAGLLAGGAMLTRPIGPAVLVGIAILAMQAPARFRALARVSVALPIFGLFPLLLTIEGEGPLGFLHAENHWRDFSVLAPLRGLYWGTRTAWDGLDAFWAGGGPYLAVVNGGALLALFGFAALSVAAWKQLGAAYGVYCVLALALPAATPTTPWPYSSMQRFVLVLFPCFIVLGALPIGRVAHRLVLATSAVAMIGVLYYWVDGAFVA